MPKVENWGKLLVAAFFPSKQTRQVCKIKSKGNEISCKIITAAIHDATTVFGYCNIGSSDVNFSALQTQNT